MINSYQQLDVWKASIKLAKLIYQVTNIYPRHELYSLVSQLRRAVVAIASNIAEGQGRRSKKEFIQFLRISFASLLELETQLIISKEIGYLTQTQLDDIFTLTTRIKQMIYKLEGALKK